MTRWTIALAIALTASTAVAYELCELPQNAVAFPSRPVPVQEDACTYFQQYESTSASTNYTGGLCGGYTIAMGKLGDLKRNHRRFSLRGEWADGPLTQTQCPKARLQGVAWGYRCDNAACTQGELQRLGAPADVHGTWNTVSKACYLNVAFAHPKADFETLKLDLIATYVDGSTVTRKRVRGRIRAEHGNGKCTTADQPPRIPPATPASQSQSQQRP